MRPASKLAGLACFRSPSRLLDSARMRDILLVTQPALQQVHTHTQPSPSKLSFGDHKAIFKGRSTTDLVRAYLVFQLCGVQPFVKNAENLIALSRRVFGEHATTGIIKHTFFKHFCAGETSDDVQQALKVLQSHGVGAILDYAAEDDTQGSSPQEQQAAAQQQPATTDSSTSTSTSQAAALVAASAPAAAATVTAAAAATAIPQLRAVARTYDYKSEMLCDKHVDIFLKAVDTAATLPGQGFAAVKLTGLGNPMLLERISRAIQEVLQLFKRFDADGSSFIDHHEFDTAYQQLFVDASAEERLRVFAWLDQQGTGRVDYVSWCQRLSLSKMPEIAARIQKSGVGPGWWQSKLSDTCLTQEEVQLLGAMSGRLQVLVERALHQRVKLMVDAEHSYFQPAIDHITLQLMRKYNKEQAWILNTYQAYLKDSHARLSNDMERAKREGYKFGVKLVRGAYLHLERKRAAELGYEDPVWGSLQATHDNYSRCLHLVLQQVQGELAEVMLGTHNQASIEQAVQLMQGLALDPKASPVYFGQLLGMADHLTLPLGMAGYKAYKYVPFGPVQEVIPYLIRRAVENSAILKGAKVDVSLLGAEIGRRLMEDSLLGRLGWTGRSKPQLVAHHSP